VNILKLKKARGIHTFPSHCKILKNKIYNTPTLHIYTLLGIAVDCDGYFQNMMTTQATC